ncbi:nucleolus protein required for cell, putative [Ichthyophthirius multifiliis]|uniref:Nucleolus protein required for cell, putative n=1 Tax=Ichthyophthirius multifiliis TaxID=5932 RepID=G0QKR9_ICHMU|nr:nucleolus protein required for cell, putative [Ichthyophthirius multifiliis]EGR34191.1 nucleolus protein required for cell, putative [Ichthyophthirius multifiliis]|eukprot:XP_004039495.1 nucleolus protein required for cell, putative [Ichthyophthirius multifiliis]
MSEIFNLGQTENIINPYKNQNKTKSLNIQDPIRNTLNNNIEIKNYEPNTFYQNQKKISYSIQNKEEYNLNYSAQQTLQNKSNNLQTTQIQGLFQLQVINSFIENYFDSIFIDQNEENVQQLRENYIKHIKNHLKNNPKHTGFTKSRILIILPFKGDAAYLLDLLEKQFSFKQQQDSTKKRLIEGYFDDDKQREEVFRIGVKIKENSLKYFVPFSNDDIIIASPLGLKLSINKTSTKDTDFSFLSSLEILIVDRAHVILMQNWQHMYDILPLLNKIPKHKQTTNNLQDIDSIYLENLSKFYRQTIIISEFQFPELNNFRENTVKTIQEAQSENSTILIKNMRKKRIRIYKTRRYNESKLRFRKKV